MIDVNLLLFLSVSVVFKKRKKKKEESSSPVLNNNSHDNRHHPVYNVIISLYLQIVSSDHHLIYENR